MPKTEITDEMLARARAACPVPERLPHDDARQAPVEPTSAPSGTGGPGTAQTEPNAPTPIVGPFHTHRRSTD